MDLHWYPLVRSERRVARFESRKRPHVDEGIDLRTILTSVIPSLVVANKA
ncbi:MAG: hypothetical protein OEM63_05795 [Gammaproteobacteria bacterium]|nr:hypothetical protein [Gammaproteobacteria bacterium]